MKISKGTSPKAERLTFKQLEPFLAFSEVNTVTSAAQAEEARKTTRSRVRIIMEDQSVESLISQSNDFVFVSSVCPASHFIFVLRYSSSGVEIKITEEKDV